jgi:lysyl-tRNA synthetase class 2
VEVNGTAITNFNSMEIDLSKWERLSMRDAIIKWWPPNIPGKPNVADLATQESFENWYNKLRINLPDEGTDQDLEPARQMIAAGFRGFFKSPGTKVIESGGRLGPALSSDDPAGKRIATLFEILAEPRLIQPTIIYDFPLAVSPLSKQKPDEPDWVERFEFYIGGFELGNAFSELNDPEEQRKRFEQQISQRERGDAEAHQMDEDYVRALAYGLPPTAGEGIGIDRLTMILTGAKSIRDVILFPLLRPHKNKPGADETRE